MPRRLAAILAADIAGYSRLVAADEEGTLASLRRIRTDLIDPLLGRHGGRIANTAGDSLLVELPSCVEAVRLALALQNGMREQGRATPADRRIEYRIGINLGDVVSEGDDLLGDGVNVAARLEQLAPAGGIVISRSVRDQVRDRMALNMADLGAVRVKNMARPVRAFQLLQTPGEKPVSVPSPRPWRLAAAAAAAVLLAALVGAGLWWQEQRRDFVPADPGAMPFALSTEPSLAVLPFESLSTEPDAEVLSEGMTESITSTLTRSPDLMVMASDSAAAALGDSPVRLGEIAERLGVHYLLRGSVQTSDKQLRVTARLVDALDGRNLWSASYDRDLDDVFAVQDDIAEKVLKQLQIRLTLESRGESRRAEDLDEYLAYLRWRNQSTRFTPEGNANAFAIARDLLTERPGSALAHEMMGMNHYVKTLTGCSDDLEEDLDAARRHYERAIELDPEDANYQWLAWVDVKQRRFDAAIEHADRGLAVAPNDPVRLRSAGAIKAMAGQPAEGVRLMRRAIRRTPIGSEWVIQELAYFLMLMGEYEEAREIALGLLERDVRDPRAHPRALRYLAAIAVWQGDPDAARGYVDRLLELRPSETVESVRDRLLRFQSNRAFVREYADALRTAGLPESAATESDKADTE